MAFENHEDWIAKLPDDVEARADVCEDCDKSDGIYPQMICRISVAPKWIRDADGKSRPIPCAVKMARFLEDPDAICKHRSSEQRAKFHAAIPFPRSTPLKGRRRYHSAEEFADFIKAVKQQELNRRRGKREKPIRHIVSTHRVR